MPGQAKIDGFDNDNDDYINRKGRISGDERREKRILLTSIQRKEQQGPIALSRNGSRHTHNDTCGLCISKLS